MILDLSVTVKLPHSLLHLFHSYLQLEVYQNLDIESAICIRIRHKREEQKKLSNLQYTETEIRKGLSTCKIIFGLRYLEKNPKQMF
jgi:hypothetical protein